MLRRPRHDRMVRWDVGLEVSLESQYDSAKVVDYCFHSPLRQAVGLRLPRMGELRDGNHSTIEALLMQDLSRRIGLIVVGWWNRELNVLLRDIGVRDDTTAARDTNGLFEKSCKRILCLLCK